MYNLNLRGEYLYKCRKATIYTMCLILVMNCSQFVWSDVWSVSAFRLEIAYIFRWTQINAHRYCKTIFPGVCLLRWHVCCNVSEYYFRSSWQWKTLTFGSDSSCAGCCLAAMENFLQMGLWFILMIFFLTLTFLNLIISLKSQNSKVRNI